MSNSEKAPGSDDSNAVPEASNVPIRHEARPNDARGVLCVKCEHLNPISREECEVCRAHLWVNCRECGAKNRRINIHCDECKRRMHKGRSKSSRSQSRRSASNWWIIGLVVGGIVLTMVLLFLVSGLKLPQLW